MRPALHLYITFRQAGWDFVSRESVLTPWRTDLLEKLTGPKVHYRAYKSRHLPLSRARSISPSPPSHFLKIHLSTGLSKKMDRI